MQTLVMMSSCILITDIKDLNKFNLIFIFLTALICSCSQGDSDMAKEQEAHNELAHTKEKATAQEFVAWCSNEENHLAKSKVISELNYQLSYLPSESMAFLELRTEEYDYEKFKKTAANYKEMTYFNFKIELSGGSGELLKYQLNSPQQYESRVKYISFQMEKDLCLVQGQDTLYPGLYHFERAFEVVPYLTVMFAFDNKKFDKEKEFTIVYNDKLFEKGLIKFNYQNRQLIDMPNVVAL